MEEALAGRDRAVLAEGRAQGRDLGGIGLHGLFVGLDHLRPLAVLDGDGRDLAAEGAVFGGAAAPGQALGRIGVLRLARELVLSAVSSAWAPMSLPS
jgi:hypothetical protein